MDLTTIPNNIPITVQRWAEDNATSNKQFVSVLEYRQFEMVERAFGIRRYRKDGIKITEVRRTTTGKCPMIWKNLTFSIMGGYYPVFKAEDRVTSNGWGFKIFDKEWFDRWDIAGMPLNFTCRCLNPEYIFTIDEFKYCGYSGGDVIEYLKAYREDPKIEFFGKLRITPYASLVNKADKDRQFCSYIAKNRNSVEGYGPQATIHAYNHNMSIAEASRKLNDERMALRHIPGMRGAKLNRIKIVDWCDANNVDYGIYSDYIEAVIALKLDLTDTKNIYPKDIQRMHDVRINELESLRAKQDRVKRKELYDKFAKAGEKAKAYEWETAKYKIIAPQDISELTAEGKALGHCVGKMGYDKKMADGKSVIMFVRQVTNVDVPLVTVEYDLHRKKVLQCYGRNNSGPSAEVYSFIRTWEANVWKKVKS